MEHDDVEVYEEGRIIPQTSADTLATIDRLKQTEIDEVVTYADLESALGFDIRTRRWILSSAMNRLLVDERMKFAVVRNVGVKRLSEAEASEVMPHKIAKVRNSARRAKKFGQRVDVMQLPKEKRAAHAANLSLAHMIEASCSTKSRQKLIAAASSDVKSASVLGIKKSLAALMGG